MSEFKISRLRFSWVGPWQDQYVYNKDEIVQYEGKAYVCLIPHTSNGFNNDLNAVEPRWELMMTGQTWKGPWEQFKRYALDNIVIFGGVVYKCNEEHLSASIIDPDIDKWDVYAESKTWKSEWTSNTTYGPGDIVNYGGSAYECTIAHVSAATDLEGLEADYTDIEDSTERYWKLSQYGVQYRGKYTTFSEDSATVRYKLNDVVKYGPSLYKCIWGHAPGIGFDDSVNTEFADTFISEYWELWLPGLDFDNVWDVDTFYQPGDVVLYGGYLFQSKIINNLGNRPSTNYGEDSTDAWEVITQAYDIEGDWVVDKEYKIGSIVNYGGDLYVALTDSVGQNPGNFEVTIPFEAEGSSGTTLVLNAEDSVNLGAITVGMTVIGEGFASGQQVETVSVDEETKLITVTLNYAPDGTISDEAVLTFVGTNFAYWELLIPGFNWEGRWAEGSLYNIDDVVYYGNATYRAIREHTSALVNRPDVDFQTNYWVIYLQHDQRNSLSQPGELVTFDSNEGNIALPIGDEASILKVVNGLPTWSDINFTTNVYYVAINGLDVPTYGTTPDTAWKTVKYACERVLEGTLQQNAKELIERNKEWITQETFYWFLYQQNQGTEPFADSVNFDNDKVIRDTRQIIDAVVKDLKKGGNSQTVAAALSYFDLESTNKFTNEEIAAQAPYFIVYFVELFNNIEKALTNTLSSTSYQQLESDRLGRPLDNGIVTQYINSSLTLESDTLTIVRALERIYVESFVAGSPDNIPSANEGAYCTINVKSGTYLEELPIVVPANTAINGDELRGTTIQPANPINTLCTRTTGDINVFTVGSTRNMVHNSPVQFVSLNPIDEISTIIGNVVAGQTYYVIGDSITDTTFSVSEVPDGPSVELQTNIGGMYVYGGNALKDMFRVRNATGIRNLTVKGLRGTLTEENEYLTRRPTGGAYVALDPGKGPDDTEAWITYKSPYIQNVTTFGKGCTGCKIDSTLHNGGNRSMVSNDFTQIISDGIGIWCKGGDALTECVSVFSYYNYAGYFAEDGAKIRATNGNSSYGTFGVISEGFDDSETPATGIINNKSGEATAEAVSALGANSEILKIQYTHGGSEYFKKVTNLLTYTNDLLDSVWTNDSNISVIRANTTPYENEFAWRVTANTSLTDSAYFEQQIGIGPQGRTYTNVAGTNISGSGIEATFDVKVLAESYEVTVNNGGSGYVIGNQIQIDGRNFGGRSPENDITVTVQDLSITAISGINHEGTVPLGSALKYNVSIHAKKGDTAYFDLEGIFSGSPTPGEEKTYSCRFNFDTEEFTTLSQLGNLNDPTDLRADFLEDGWWRLSYSIFDETAQNTNLTMRVYPRGIDGIAGYTNFYGAQILIGDTPDYFVENTDSTPTVHANINITGAGTGVKVIADEVRTGSIFQSRILESETVRLGGLGYNIQSNNAQGGSTELLILAQSEVATATEYEGMRLVVQSGIGAGQYGIISNYDPVTKYASVVKESFDQQEIVAVNTADNTLIFGPNTDFHGIFVGQKIEFTPTFYNIDVLSSSQSGVNVLGTLGDLNNYMYVDSTARLRIGQKINFSGTTFGGVIVGFDYYIIDVIDDRTIQISTSLGGAVWPLSNVNIEDPDDSPIVLTGEIPPFTLNYPDQTSFLEADTTANMEVTLPIQFTGKSIGGVELGATYYIHEVYNDTEFAISEALLPIEVTASSAVDNSLTIADTSGLNSLNPIIFKEGTILGGLQEKTKYYVNSILNGTNFTLASDIITTTATATEGISNLITVDSTAGFIVNAPIKFTGVTFGQLDNDEVYYIQVVNDATSFTISETPGGAAVPLTTAVGNVIVTTVLDEIVLTTTTGTMNGQTTGTKLVLEAGRDAMEGSFFTEIFGGIVEGTKYFVTSKTDTNSSYEITISETEGGPDVTLIDETGSMQINEVGWDHINAGTPLVTQFDSTSVYIIEPRITFDKPNFYVELLPTIQGGDGLGFCAIVSDGYKMLAIPRQGDTVLGTSDYTDWDEVYTLPISGTPGTNGGWVDACYGNNTWFILSADGTDCLVSAADGLTWLSVDLPSLGGLNYAAVTYGNGTFVAVANGGSQIAYSNNNGITWTSVVSPAIGDEDWIDITYGKETFVVISRSNDIGKYSTDGGVTWIGMTLREDGDGSTIDNWSSVEFGNGRFVAISRDDRPSAYSFNGINWYASNVDVSGSFIKYGQGVFVVINPDTGICYTSPDGYTWDQETDTVGGDYDVCAFGIDRNTDKGWFMTIDEFGSSAYKARAGCKAFGRASVSNARITGISLLETGSGYTDDSFGPGVTITDPNNSEEALIQIRIGDGTLGAPTFISQGSGYNSTSTAIAIRGDGFSDSFQTGLEFIAKGITRFPAPGDNLQFDGNPEIYRVASATRLRGTEVPNLEALISISPQLTQETAPENDTPFTIRSRFSQCRITNHDFLNIGFGNEIQSNYPNLPVDTGLEPQDEVQETNNGRVFYSSTDQDGNFRVGDLFAVEQATGVVTLSASEFGLEGLTELSIGGVALGGSPTVITEFSTDGTFVANSNNIVPTQRAIRTYLASRLSQGGSDTFTGLLQAGTVKVGGPDEITSSIPEGGEDWQVKIGTKAMVEGPTAAWAGDGLAMAYFFKTFVDPTRGDLQ